MSYIHYYILKQKKNKLGQDHDNDELTKELRLFRKIFEENVILNEETITTQQVYDILIPNFYKKGELDNLLIEASALRDWFLKSDGQIIIINRKNLNMKVQRSKDCDM